MYNVVLLLMLLSIVIFVKKLVIGIIINDSELKNTWIHTNNRYSKDEVTQSKLLLVG